MGYRTQIKLYRLKKRQKKLKLFQINNNNNILEPVNPNQFKELNRPNHNDKSNNNNNILEPANPNQFKELNRPNHNNQTSNKEVNRIQPVCMDLF